jgi:pimeloyl-ACP methyl ester carboxylesterase
MVSELALALLPSAPLLGRKLPTTSAVKNIVLVHGAFADGSSWSRVIPLLQEMGYHAVAVQNPLTSLADEVTSKGMLDYIAEGLPEADRRLYLAVQGQSYGPMFDEKLTIAAWKTKPTWAIVSTKDQMLPPAMEISAAQRMSAVTTTLATCHMSILEEPAQVAMVIDQAAKDALRGEANPARPLFSVIV